MESAKIMAYEIKDRVLSQYEKILEKGPIRSSSAFNIIMESVKRALKADEVSPKEGKLRSISRAVYWACVTPIWENSNGTEGGIFRLGKEERRKVDEEWERYLPEIEGRISKYHL